MEIVAIELPHAFGSIAAQLATLGRVLEALAPPEAGVSRLVVLPETSLTGYLSLKGDFDLSHFGEAIDGPTNAALARLARTHGTAIAGPWIERDDSRTFNTTVVFDAAGTLVARYRKRHPWYPETWATAGAEDIPLFTVGGRTLTACVCFDVHFVRDESGAVLDRADVLLFPSAWVEGEASSDEANDRVALLRDIAREHRAVVVNANWGEGAPRIRGQGDSRIFDASGEDVGVRSTAAGVPVVTCRV